MSPHESRESRESAGIPHNVFTLPTERDITLAISWVTVRHVDNFLLQKTHAPDLPLFNSLMNTVTSVFGTKQSAFRILFQRDVNTTCLEIAVAETEELIESAWLWIERNMIPELDTIDDPRDKQEWVTVKIKMIAQKTNFSTDEFISDDKYRDVSRAFRHTFDVPPSERLVNYYSCACNGRQGWMYISENYIGFSSFLFGVKTQILVELKDVQDIIKEDSKRSMFPDSLRVKSKDKEDYVFSIMFKRDEVNDLLVQLKSQAVHRLLNNTNGSAPGASNRPTSGTTLPASSSEPPSIQSSEGRQIITPLKQDLATEKRNTGHCIHFRLPLNEQLIDAMEVTYTKKPTDPAQEAKSSHNNVTRLTGRLYLSSTYLAYESQERLPRPQHHQPVCWAVFPLYTIRRVERINADSYSSVLSMTTWHKMEHVFQLLAPKTACESFCEKLQKQLQLQTMSGRSKLLKTFLQSCESEVMLNSAYREDKLVDVSDNDTGGLGLQFGYPGDAKQSRDRRKTKLWGLYFLENGRNMTLVKLPAFGKLVRVGLPNSLRGEIWEACSGAMYMRFANPGTYKSILKDHVGHTSTSTEEIEKDLNRSLPEYAAYQTQSGIDRLRNVLQAYAWQNPRLGYCQAMNIVTSALLIYTTEEQAFWILNVLVDRMCPGYYSTSMYGAILDQMILEQLMEKTMPILWKHFTKTDVQLSVACLPWFLSLYVNSMPLLFAFRVLDCFFMDGPKILFQIGLAILKLNGEELLQVTDDGAFLDILKHFFATLDEPVNNADTTGKRLTKFNKVILIAYQEFSSITDDLVNEMRQQNQVKVVAGIESFTKRTIIRHLKDMAGFSKDEIAIIYDKFFGALYYAKEQDDKEESQLDLETFRRFLASMTEWARLKAGNGESTLDTTMNQLILRFIDRLHCYFRSGSGRKGVSFQDAVLGLSDIFHGDLMSRIEYFFNMYDHDQDGLLSGENIVAMSKDLLWFFIQTGMKKSEALDAVRSLIRNSIEQTEIASGSEPNENDLHNAMDKLDITGTNGTFRQCVDQLDAFLLHQPAIKLSLPSFRMVVLTIESTELFFDKGFSASFKLEHIHKEQQKSLGRELFENLFAEGRKMAINASARTTRQHSDETPSPSSSSMSHNSVTANTSPSLSEKAETAQDVSKEVDHLFTELGQFDV